MNSDMMDQFEVLYQKMDQYVLQAEKLSTPNEEDTLEIRMAIIGFGLTYDIETWGLDEFEHVHGELTQSEELTERERLFYALGMGYLLGLLAAKKLIPLEFQGLSYVLPGFIYEKGGDF